ncbi:Zn-ribbon domain-containing OB-fold protein [Pseudomonas nitroreducens]|nr:OB-fold domain-containing protein [Pseudomonas nitroreducens]
MSETPMRPLPELNGLNRAFWTGGARGELLIQRCVDCRHWLHPAGIVCPQCMSRNLGTEAVSGLGTIEALTVNHQPWTPGQAVPYAIAIVSLDEQDGLQLTTNIVGCDPLQAHIGQRVRVVFEHQDDVYLPFFTPS